VFRNVGIKNSDAGESPKRKNTNLNILSKIVEVIRSYLKDINIPEKTSQICIFLRNGRHVYHDFFFILTRSCNDS